MALQVDVEGFDVPAYYGMQSLLQFGRVPFATIEFNPRMANELAQCDAFRFVRHQHSIGYVAAGAEGISQCRGAY